MKRPVLYEAECCVCPKKEKFKYFEENIFQLMQAA
jgi:hypothetical protein